MSPRVRQSPNTPTVLQEMNVYFCSCSSITIENSRTRFIYKTGLFLTSYILITAHPCPLGHPSPHAPPPSASHSNRPEAQRCSDAGRSPDLFRTAPAGAGTSSSFRGGRELQIKSHCVHHHPALNAPINLHRVPSSTPHGQIAAWAAPDQSSLRRHESLFTANITFSNFT